jgi:CMP-N,N'-diacetyllegionaminic acid synthase
VYDNKKILGLITARGGSKGLPRKNIMPLLDKPLIGWSIDQAIASKYLDKIAVSTDSEEIATTSRNFGAEVPFLRPEYLSSDSATSVDVINHTLDYYVSEDQYFDYIALLEPTSPLRETSDIDLAIEKLINNSSKASSIVAVGKAEVYHPMFCVQIDTNDFLKPYHNILANQVRRQDLPQAFFYAGVIYISKTIDFKKYNGFNHEKTLAYLIPKWKTPEIDDIYDFIHIEAILNYRNNINRD